jgi:NAD(P)-dependent dehydrogenase (short-subunit alcohol dehydrogenase family)
MDTIGFEGRCAIVTGAASGIGRVIAVALAARGAHVLVNDLHGADATVAVIREHGGTAVADATPVGDFAAAQRIVDAALAAFGRVDIVVNNAGTSAPGAFDEPSDAQCLQVLQVNLIGALALSRTVWPLLRAQAYGRILNIASNAALGQGRSAAYAASKGGLIALTKDNAREGAASNIKANAMLPIASTTMTARIPPGAFRDWIDHGFPPEKIAAPALYLLSDRVAASGEIFSCGGGRIARTAYLNTHGYFDADATPEGIAAHFDAVMDTRTAVLIENQSQELDRYTEWLPWPEAGGMPGLKV